MKARTDQLFSGNITQILRSVESGTAITSSNKSVVDTAGHCVYYDDTWATNWIFCPQYQNGNSPFGCWTANQVFTTTLWTANQNDFANDIGMAVVQPLNGETLQDAVGGAGYLPNESYTTLTSQTITAYGYPAASPFNGQQMYSVSGPVIENSDGSLTMIGNDMTGGSSGGPWFITIQGIVYLIGHNDAANDSDDVISPYYDGTIW